MTTLRKMHHYPLYILPLLDWRFTTLMRSEEVVNIRLFLYATCKIKREDGDGGGGEGIPY